MSEYSFILILIFILFSGCTDRSASTRATHSVTQESKTQNSEQTVEYKLDSVLYSLYSEDQSDRKYGQLYYYQIAERDSVRRVKADSVLDNTNDLSGQDYFHAAMIFHHGTDSSHYKRAMKLMDTAISKDSLVFKWLRKAAEDRYLLSIGKPQIYGTQN